MLDLINATLKEEMRRNERVTVFGEDVADCSREGSLSEVKGKGGVFGVTAGLQTEFGKHALLQFADHAEASIVGRADRHGHCRAQTNCGNSVLRLHLARHDAAP